MSGSARNLTGVFSLHQINYGNVLFKKKSHKLFSSFFPKEISSRYYNIGVLISSFCFSISLIEGSLSSVVFYHA